MQSGDVSSSAVPVGAAPALGSTRRQLLTGVVGVGLAIALPGGAARAAAPTAPPALPAAAALPPDVALDWVRTTYELVRAENLSPPAAARVYAYTAVAMYEAVLGGMPRHRSLAGQLRGLSTPPARGQQDRIDWPSALVASAAAVLRQVLPFAGPDTRAALDAAEATALAGRRAAGVPERSVLAGTDHGRDVARHLTRWIARDGHAGVVGRAYTPPTGSPELWESTPPNYRPAIEPYWSQVRPMVLRRPDEVVPEPPIPFSTEPGSAFYEQAMAPYRQSFVNTADQQAIARFWTDNPGSFTAPFGSPTGLPSGHWMLIATQALALRGARLDLAVETLALTGAALHDAFVNCWTWKYRHNLLRPVTYVNRYIDPTWTTLVNSPQFPEHTSGHSVASPAAAVVLTDRLGSFAFTDRSHDPARHAPRSFSSFHDAAGEAAQSRLYGGIHFPHAIEAGLTQGREIGELVLRRVRTRR